MDESCRTGVPSGTHPGDKVAALHIGQKRGECSPLRALGEIEPWRRTEDPDTLRAIVTDAGVPGCEIHSEVDVIPVEPGDWWRIVMGTGLRRTATALDPAESERVRERCERFMREHDVLQVKLASHHIIAIRS